MRKSILIVEDEKGELWEVGKGEPAYDIVSSLIRKGYNRIVLPIETLRTGKVPNEAPSIGKLAGAYFDLQRDGASKPILKDMERAYLLAATLQDCVAPSPVIQGW